MVAELKSNISTTISSAKKIDLEEVFEFEEEVSDFVNEWEDELENFSEIFHSQINEYSDELSTIERLLKLRDVCIQTPEAVISFSDNFGDNAESLGSAIEFILLVNKAASDTQIFESAPDISHTKLSVLKDKIKEIGEAKGIFGYLFSGSKLETIKSSIDSLIGYRPRKNKGDELIQEVSSLVRRADQFYERVEAYI